MKASKCIFLCDQSVFFLSLPNSTIINCHFSVLSQSLCSVHSTVARIYKAQTWCRGCSQWRLVYTVTVARWQLMTHKSGQVKCHCHTRNAAQPRAKIIREMIEICKRCTCKRFLISFGTCTAKKKERYSQSQGPQQTEKEESWTTLWAQNCANGWNGASS